MTDILLPQRFLFRFAAPCRFREKLWTKKGAALDASHRLPALAELEGRPQFAEVRVGWNRTGLAFVLIVEPKRAKPWCRAEQPDDSDGLHLWIDTRDVHDIHRATRFCHQLYLMPAGGGEKLGQPMAGSAPIHRAQANSRAISPEELELVVAIHPKGYRLDAFIPAGALTGFNPEEHPRLGFQYAVKDRELGTQTFAAGAPLPYDEDPSLWATLELTRD
ncbi:MAG: hypothetical protein U1E05_06480 [Patescibacteria group bacterium]|nr:hypothetical protein [Patescibacteria group bacterium]